LLQVRDQAADDDFGAVAHRAQFNS
jgi:hypothetical protein